MLSRRNQHALLHETGGIADAGNIAAAGFNGKAVEIGTAENDPRACGSGQDFQIDGSAAMQTNATATDRSPNCLLMCQTEVVRPLEKESL